MSLKKVESVKQETGFKLPDLIVYGVILLLVAALLIIVFTTRNKEPFQGVRVYVNKNIVMSYNFDKDGLNGLDVTAEDGTVEVPESVTGSVFTVRVQVGEGEYNVIEIDRSLRSVRVVDANCGKRDCVHTPAITDNNGIIYCSPHGLRIVPFDFEVEDDGGKVRI